MNAITLLPLALPAMALGTYAMLRFARWLDMPSKAARMRREAHIWHNTVVDLEVAQGIYTYDGSITDIKPITFM